MEYMICSGYRTVAEAEEEMASTVKHPMPDNRNGVGICNGTKMLTFT